MQNKNFDKITHEESRQELRIQVLDVLKAFKEGTKKIKSLWERENVSDIIEHEELLDIISLKKIIPYEYDVYLDLLDKEIERRSEIMNNTMIPLNKFDNILNSRWNSIKELENHFGFHFREIDTSVEIVDFDNTDFVMCSVDEINSDYQGWGRAYLIVTFLRSQQGIFITDCFMN